MLIGEGQSSAGGVEATLGHPHVSASWKRRGTHHAFSIAVIAAGGRSPQPFDELRVALSERYATSRESNGQQKPAEPAGSRAKHSHSSGYQVSRRTRT